MTSQIRSHIEYLIHLLYPCVHFIVEIAEKSSRNDGFQYDLIMVSDSGLLFWGPVDIMVFCGDVVATSFD